MDDQAAKEDVEYRGEEDGGDDEGYLLANEGIAAIGAFGGVNAGGPANDFGCDAKNIMLVLLGKPRATWGSRGTYSVLQWRGVWMWKIGRVVDRIGRSSRASVSGRIG